MVVAFTSSLSTASSVTGANVGDASGRSSVSSSTVARFTSSLPLVSSVADSKVANEETEDVVTAEAVYSRIGQYNKSKRKRKKEVHIQLHQVIVFEFPWVKKLSWFFEGDNRENT
jgi:hypothetical protein